MQPTILITGATGFVGVALMERLAQAGRVVGVGHTRPGPNVVQSDIRDPAQFRALMNTHRPDVVVHAAAYPDPDFCEQNRDEARRLNVATVATLVESLPAAARLVHISTDYVFQGNRPPYRENDLRNPVCVYGQTKVEAEDLVARRPRSIILRIPLQVGAPQRDGRPGFIPLVVRQLRSDAPAEVYDLLMRYPTWTCDVAEAVVFLLRTGAEGVFHVSGPEGGTRWYWTRRIAEILGISWHHLRPTKESPPRPAVRPLDTALETGRVRSAGAACVTEGAECCWVRHSAPVAGCRAP